MRTDTPIHTDIVLVGGGHAHVDVLKQFGMRPEPGVRLTLLSPSSMTPYSGMLPGYLAGHYTLDEAHIDLRPLCRFAGARFLRTAAVGIDRENRRVLCADRPPVPYDLLGIDIGSTPSHAGIEGAERALPVKPVDRFLDAWTGVEQAILAARGRHDIAVVGAGAGGVEAALALAWRARRMLEGAGHDPAALNVAIVSATPEPMPDHGTAARRRMRRALDRMGIAFHGGHRVTAIDDGRLVCDPPLDLAADTAILVTPGAPPAWLRDTGLALDEAGFVRVGATLQSVSDPAILAAGDVVAFEPRPLPKSGVYAVRAGPVLGRNLRRLATGRTPRRFRPQRRTLALVSMGEKRAVLSRGPFGAEGAWAWRLKDWIDRRWMRKYCDLPDMAADSVEDDAAMRCGGCGAKVPADILHRVLDRLPAAATPDPTVLVGLDAPDDAAVLQPPPGALLVQTVDHFRALIDDPYLFGRIAANHCMGDIHAMGARPSSALATVTLPHADPAKTEQDLEQLLRGALAAFDEAGVVLLGGHTGEGAELSLGFTVNGFAEPGSLLRKGGMVAGDALLLTRPLGTGVLLAADMRGRAAGRDIDRAIAGMLRSNRSAADILHAHGATAATDVTGFGLLGHLAEMCAASGMAAVIERESVPVLPGAEALLAAGIESTLQPANRRNALRHLAGGGDPRAGILFDPQTAGGLLASVPAERADACLGALRAAGDTEAAIIGRVVRGAVQRPGSGPAITFALR